MTIEITLPEVETLINQRLRSGAFNNAEDLILCALQAFEFEYRRGEAIERLKSFGDLHGLSLAEMTIRELREQARP